MLEIYLFVISFWLCDLKIVHSRAKSKMFFGPYAELPATLDYLPFAPLERSGGAELGDFIGRNLYLLRWAGSIEHRFVIREDAFLEAADSLVQAHERGGPSGSRVTRWISALQYKPCLGV